MTTTTLPLTVAARLVDALLTAGAIPPDRRGLALRVAGITDEDLRAAKRETPRLVGSKDQPLKRVPWQPARPTLAPVPPPRTQCRRCQKWLVLAAFDGRTACEPCRAYEAAQAARKNARRAAEAKEREQASRRLTAPLIAATTIRLSHKDGEMVLDLVCRSCGEKVTPENIAGFCCTSCNTQPKESA